MSIGTVRLLERALAGDERDRDDATAQRILDAALELVAASGLRHLTMDDVAERARVGRMTVYRRFGSRQELIDALAIREARTSIARIASAPDPRDGLEDRVAAVFVAVMAVIREHPLLGGLARTEPEALLREITRNDSEVFALVRSFLVAQIESAQSAGELAEGDPAALAELALRLGASFVLIPDSVIAVDDERRAHEMVRGLIAPHLHGRVQRSRA